MGPGCRVAGEVGSERTRGATRCTVALTPCGSRPERLCLPREKSDTWSMIEIARRLDGSNERAGITFGTYNPEGMNLKALRDVVEKIGYNGVVAPFRSA